MPKILREAFARMYVKGARKMPQAEQKESRSLPGEKHYLASKGKNEKKLAIADTLEGLSIKL